MSSGLLCDAAVQPTTQLAIEAGHRGVKARRRERRIANRVPGGNPPYQPVGPGGMVADYAPFYFAPRSPTLNAIFNGRVAEYQEGQEPLVFLVTDLAKVLSLELPFVFSDGNCATAVTAFFEKLEDLDKVDWELMEATWWFDTPEDPDRRRRRAAEFLVHQCVPWEAFLGIATMNVAMADIARAELAKMDVELPVLVRRDWYF